MHLYPSAHRWWVSTLLHYFEAILRINRCTHAHIQTVVDIDTSFTLWRIPDGFDDLGTRAVKIETNKEQMCEHCRKNSACRGSVCLPSCPIVCKNAQDQAGFFFHVGHALQLRCASCGQWYIYIYIHVEHNDNHTLKQHPSSKHSYQYLPACLSTVSIWYYLAYQPRASIPARIASLRDLSARKC